ncbi:competence protein ComK [Niallia endozanthoxylica]|uniref:Uncharacterized protein n=1 Tax=Niallia endozanthoxylica TaxID=2036016 RepID=A0A5J5H1I8_9BACI|nr:competence protein ComK [Niallia endozanthoxylica]KAA9013808.1 hypothetical protein F4V44_24390 [Niallia endozanthoxylica]
MFSQYIINRYTDALASHFHNGYEYTQVLEGTETFLVAQSPDDIVKESFLQNGSTLEGAIESARYHLNKKYKLPVVLSAKHHIALIRCPAVDKTGIVWLVHSHIHSIEPDPNHHNKTIVHTNHGHSFTIDMKLDRLQTRRSQASFLNSTLLKNSEMNKAMTFFYDKDHGFQLVKKTGQLNYTLKKNNDIVKLETE